MMPFLIFICLVGPIEMALAVDATAIDLSTFKLPVIPGVELELPKVDGLCQACHELPSFFESTGCNVSSVPTVANFTPSSIIGNWYQLYYGGPDLLQKFHSDFYTVTDVRFTIAGDSRSPDVLSFYRCGLNSYFGGFYTHDVCPAGAFKMSFDNGVLTSDALEVMMPIASLITRIKFDQIQVRLIAMDDDFIVTYSCLLPLEDGTCAKGGLHLDVHSKNRQLSAAARDRLKVLTDATCINFEKLKIIKQEIDIPFYEPTEE